MIAKIYNYSGWLTVTNPPTLDKVFSDMLAESDFHVLGQIAYNFTPQGFTKLWLLGESHFAVHTFPERGKTYFELSSCNDIMYNKFVGMIKELEVNYGTTED